jgi:hemoglobin
LRIAQSLQLSRFGWNYTIPVEQQELLERITPARRAREERDPPAHAAAGTRGEPFPAKIIGRSNEQ